MRNAMVGLAGIVMGALLVGPLRGDGAAFDTCTVQGTYSLSALADAGNSMQALGLITVNVPAVCTGGLGCAIRLGVQAVIAVWTGTSLSA